MKTSVRVNKCIVFGNATAIQSRDQTFKRIKLFTCVVYTTDYKNETLYFLKCKS